MLDADRSFLQAICAGEHDVCLILADYLADRGDEARARRLRRRYRLWQTRRTNGMAALERIRATIRNTQIPPHQLVWVMLAGKAYLMPAREVLTRKDWWVFPHEDGLLREYVRRLLQETGH